MFALRRLFNPRKSLHHFALLDAQGICRALRQCERAPATGRWVEVSESRLTWLGNSLPASAHLVRDEKPARTANPLAA